MALSKFDDTNEPMVGGPYRPVLCPEGVNAGKGYWIENDKGVQFTGTKFYRLDEHGDSASLCLLLNAAYTQGVEEADPAAAARVVVFVDNGAVSRILTDRSEISVAVLDSDVHGCDEDSTIVVGDQIFATDAFKQGSPTVVAEKVGAIFAALSGSAMRLASTGKAPRRDDAPSFDM